MTKLRPDHLFFTFVVVATVTACGATQPAEEAAAEAIPAQDEQLTKLYVFDCGRITIADVSQFSIFSLSEDEVSTMVAAVPCFLIEHPQGTLMWDLGLSEALYPDGMTIPEGPLTGSTLAVETTLTNQLAVLGYAPSDIDYIAMSHMHFDHAGNTNLFLDATWLAREAERDYAFGEPEGLGWDPEFYEGLRNVEPVLNRGAPRRVRGWDSRHPVSPRPHAWSPGALHRLSRDRASRSQWRPISLSRESRAQAGSTLQLRRGANPRGDGCGGGLPSREWRWFVDRARLHAQRYSQEVSRVLPVVPDGPML